MLASSEFLVLIFELILFQHHRASNPSKKPTSRDRILVMGSETARATLDEHESEKEKRDIIKQLIM
jgi:hypothetical protein